MSLVRFLSTVMVVVLCCWLICVCLLLFDVVAVAC